MPVADILRYNSLTWPDRVALVAGDRRITFSELEQAVWRLAGDRRLPGPPGRLQEPEGCPFLGRAAEERAREDPQAGHKSRAAQVLARLRSPERRRAAFPERGHRFGDVTRVVA